MTEFIPSRGPFNWYWHYLGRRDVGGLINHPERSRRIIDTSVSP